MIPAPRSTSQQCIIPQKRIDTLNYFCNKFHVFSSPSFFLTFQANTKECAGAHPCRAFFIHLKPVQRFRQKSCPGKSPGPDTSITILRLCRFCSELLFIIHSKHKKQLRHAAFLFCIFHTVLLPERFADHRSAFTFGTHLWDSPEGHPVTVPSVFHGHLRVLFLRRAFACFPATFYWLDM